MSEPEIVLEEVSPNGQAYVIAEQDERCCYFYLHAKERSAFGVKSCWVRNFHPAPDELVVEDMRAGNPPLLPRAFCGHPNGAPRFKEGDLGVIWAEEGDAAALTHLGEIIAVIPSWGGMNGFHGYARDCLGQSPLGWALGSPEINAQFAKYERASAFWKSWSEDRESWSRLQGTLCEALETALGQHSNYYAIDGDNWPPKAMLRIPSQGHVALATIGVCIQPQPKVEMHYEDPSLHCRIELGMALDASFPDDAIKKVASYISAQSNLPWSKFTFLGQGHTIPADVVAELSDEQLAFVLLVKSGLGIPTMSLPKFRDDPINLLWMIPITEREREFAQANGSAQLIERLERVGVNWVSTMRRKSVC